MDRVGRGHGEARVELEKENFPALAVIGGRNNWHLGGGEPAPLMTARGEDNWHLEKVYQPSRPDVCNR